MVDGSTSGNKRRHQIASGLFMPAGILILWDLRRGHKRD